MLFVSSDLRLSITRDSSPPEAIRAMFSGCVCLLAEKRKSAASVPDDVKSDVLVNEISKRALGIPSCFSWAVIFDSIDGKADFLISEILPAASRSDSVDCKSSRDSSSSLSSFVSIDFNEFSISAFLAISSPRSLA